MHALESTTIEFVINSRDGISSNDLISGDMAHSLARQAQWDLDDGARGVRLLSRISFSFHHDLWMCQLLWSWHSTNHVERMRYHLVFLVAVVVLIAHVSCRGYERRFVGYYRRFSWHHKLRRTEQRSWWVCFLKVMPLFAARSWATAPTTRTPKCQRSEKSLGAPKICSFCAWTKAWSSSLMPISEEETRSTVPSPAHSWLKSAIGIVRLFENSSSDWIKGNQVLFHFIIWSCLIDSSFTLPLKLWPQPRVRQDERERSLWRPEWPQDL